MHPHISSSPYDSNNADMASASAPTDDGGVSAPAVESDEPNSGTRRVRTDSEEPDSGAHEVRADADHSIDRIIDAVRDLVVNGGISKISYRSVARAAGLSLGTVTYYFRSRNELMEAVLERHHRLAVQIARPIASNLHAVPTRALAAVLRRLVRHSLDNRSEVRLRISSWAQHWSLPRVRREELDDLLSRATSREWAYPGDAVERRIIIQAVNYGVQHLTAMTDEDLMNITGVDDVETARRQLSDTVANLGVFLLSGTVPPKEG